MLFVKYISDVWQDHYDECKKQFGNDEDRIQRRMERERFVLPEEGSFTYLYENREAPNVGELINIGLEKIEMANKAKLINVFRNIDFNSESRLGNTRKRQSHSQEAAGGFRRQPPQPSAQPDRQPDVIGNAYEYLIGRFGAGAGKKAGEFYTPLRYRRFWPRFSIPNRGRGYATLPAAPAHYSSSAPGTFVRRTKATTSRSSARRRSAAPGPSA